MNNQKKIDIKSLSLTFFLIFALLLIVYAFIGMLISGPYYKNIDDETKIEKKIASNHKKVESIQRNSFEYVTYTLMTKQNIFIYDEKGKRIIKRSKDSLQFDEVKAIINKKYPSLNDVDIKVGYGYDGIAYVIEKDYELLVIDYDELNVLFYMKEGE